MAATVLFAVALFRPPGDSGADICGGSAQRFGMPLGFAGPHAGDMPCRADVARKVPERIIDVRKDTHGDRALRMALKVHTYSEAVVLVLNGLCIVMLTSSHLVS